MRSLPSPVVSASWLAQNMDHVRIVDVRWSIPTGPMRSDYEQGHIPGAVFADLDCDLSGSAGQRGRHPLPTPQDFANTRTRLAMSVPVVAYDDCSGSVASRLWWMLDSIGIDAAVLDGGIQAWTGPMSQGIETVEPVSVDPTPWPDDRFIDASKLLSSIEGGAVVVDARSADRFAGRPNPIDTRPGHVPGSFSRPWQDNLESTGQFLEPDVLRSALTKFSIEEGTDLITCCGSGVTGCHNLLAARIAGFDKGRLYTGSWSEWSQDPDRPVRTNL